MSGSGIINHPLRDEHGLEKKGQKKSIIISASIAVLPRTFVKALGATFVWLHACVSTAENTVVCTYSSSNHPVLQNGYASCTDFSSIIKWSQNFLVKFPLDSRKFWAWKIPRLGEFELFSWGNFAEHLLATVMIEAVRGIHIYMCTHLFTGCQGRPTHPSLCTTPYTKEACTCMDDTHHHDSPQRFNRVFPCWLLCEACSVYCPGSVDNNNNSR